MTALNMTRVYIPKVVLIALLLATSCKDTFLFPPKPYVPPFNETETILFISDNEINEGMGLPVEVIYVTGSDDLKQVTDIGPDVWFESKEREGWPFKQTLMLKGGEEILFKLNKPSETKYIVVFATFFRVKDQEAQQVILDPDAGEQAVVWVGARAIYHYEVGGE